MGSPSRIKFQAEGITCSGCAVDAETVMNNVDGILKASVDYSSGLISVDYNPSEIHAEKITSMLNEMGFRTKAV